MKDSDNVCSMMEGELNTLYMDLPEPEHANDINTCTNCILDVDYKKADVDKYPKDYERLPPEERQSLRKLLKKYEALLDRTLKKWKHESVSLWLKPNAKLVQSRLFCVPCFHEENIKKGGSTSSRTRCTKEKS